MGAKTAIDGSLRAVLDISAYLVVGPENTRGRSVGDVVAQALEAGFTCFQVRSKECSARELIACTAEAAKAIAQADASQRAALVVNDRLDVVLAARDAGIKVDGIHVGQTDIPVEVCRRYLGLDAVVGLSARTAEMIEYVRTTDMSLVDYVGVGPLHETATKPDCGLDASGAVITRSMEELEALVACCPVPLVVGGGVKATDVALLAHTGVDGFFVVSAVCAADDPRVAAAELVAMWKNAQANTR